MSWDSYFMGMAVFIASKSKDRSRKTSAIIVSVENSVLSTGFNGFPRGVNDDIDARHERPAKYKWTEHAERNAIYNAARNGIRTGGMRMFMPWYPCIDCARSIIQAGIIEIICVEPDWNDPIWAKDFADVPTMLREGNVSVRFVSRI